MRKNEKIARCIAVYKKNNACDFICLGDMRRFLIDEMGLKIQTKLRKPEVTEIFLGNLSAKTYPKYQKLKRFGLIRRDVQEALGISEYQAKKMVKNRELGVKAEFTSTKGDFHMDIPIYDMDSVLSFMK